MKRDYKELIVWQKGIDLVVEIYRATRAFPKRGALRPDIAASPSCRIGTE